MKKKVIVLLWAVILCCTLAAGCGKKNTLADGTYTADFNTDSSMFHVNEAYDGKGSQDGLAGTEIPIHARIVAVADCYDAMNSRRIYRNALPPEVVYEEFRKKQDAEYISEFDRQIAAYLKGDKL